MIEQFYFPEMLRESIEPIEKDLSIEKPIYSEDPFLHSTQSGFQVKIETAEVKPKFVSLSPFLNIIEKAFEDEKTTRKETKRKPKKVHSKSDKTAVESIQEEL